MSKKYPLKRTFVIDDITPEELATEFLGMDDKQQARFFNAFKDETDKWTGAGWCRQCCALSVHLDKGGIETILKLGEWAADPYRRVTANQEQPQ